ncbi:MaoC/PaaZ C-terminal domain-containing protein [Actinocatenispora rupis]|uniref:Acyl dehydratase n=1 Tax=Actinocatenispora rupis TaxID=519421 RepID=A0A8J3NA05_9ACTN|nr:MaoC/PaaZ C-terminal domain-containing protein [Actinocatenispora rupis]GID11869.1 acyl dehydratase [Actinocatenispora rupis]
MRSGTGAVPDWYYEDLTPGRVFDLGVVEVDGAEMLAFARRFDPQWYHVDPVLAQESGYGGLIASGWFTASLFMRGYVDHVLSRAAAAASPGVEEMRWKAPVYAGDKLAGELVVTDREPSRTRPGLGTVHLTGTLRRLADGEPDAPVLVMRFRGWFARRDG